MAYNTNPLSTRPMNGLVNSGADLMKNMYDVKIFFPTASGIPKESEPFKSYPITVRAAGFKVPDVEAAVYDIKYHGITIKRPKTEQTMDRSVTITFREDGAFDLRRRFSAWLMAVSDPVTGGTSNAAQFFGALEVSTVAGAYFASTLAIPDGKGGPHKDGEVFDFDGHLTNSSKFNPLAIWRFYNAWVSKVNGVDFSTETADPNTFDVVFQYMDVDFPQFGGNPLDVDAETTWAPGNTSADSPQRFGFESKS